MGPHALNLSTRGLVSVGDNVLIGGFIVSGPAPKTMVLRALGPSLSGFGLSDVLADPVLSVYNSSGTLIATNDNWQSDPIHFIIEANGLAPANLLESATGALIGSNDNWQDNVNSIDIRRNGLAPPNPSESAIVLHLPAGKYTAIVHGADRGTGVGLAEVYTLH